MSRQEQNEDRGADSRGVWRGPGHGAGVCAGPGGQGGKGKAGPLTGPYTPSVRHTCHRSLVPATGVVEGAKVCLNTTWPVKTLLFL